MAPAQRSPNEALAERARRQIKDVISRSSKSKKSSRARRVGAAPRSIVIAAESTCGRGANPEKLPEKLAVFDPRVPRTYPLAGRRGSGWPVIAVSQSSYRSWEENCRNRPMNEPTVNHDLAARSSAAHRESAPEITAARVSRGGRMNLWLRETGTVGITKCDLPT